jgi:glycosyltransferase involved in cell wall biosynthesis
MFTNKLSVIMPVYNSEKYVFEAIYSILNQTFTDFQFIIINDGSIDNTLKIIKRIRDKRIVIIENHYNFGIVRCLNYGLDIARGEYIARMDSDDISLLTRFEKQIFYLDKNNDVGIVGTWFKIFGNQNKIVMHKQIVDINDFLDGNKIGHSTVMMRKSILDKYHLRYDQNFESAEDMDLWTRAIQYTQIHNLQEILLKYRWHDKNISILHKKQQDELTNIILSRIKIIKNDNTRIV